METPKSTATQNSGGKMPMPPVPNNIVLEREQRTISIRVSATATASSRATTDTFDIDGNPIAPSVYRYERITQLTRIGD